MEQMEEVEQSYSKFVLFFCLSRSFSAVRTKGGPSSHTIRQNRPHPKRNLPGNYTSYAGASVYLPPCSHTAVDDVPLCACDLARLNDIDFGRAPDLQCS